MVALNMIGAVPALTAAAPLAPANCPPCPLHWDQSGGVDGDDIAAFFDGWMSCAC